MLFVFKKGNSKAVVAAEGRHDGFGGGHWNGVGQESAAGWGWKGEGGWGEQNYSFKKNCVL